MSRICWNAIVKNEAARIDRCVSSLLPHIACGVVVDTGSSDNTVEVITRMFADAGKPLQIGQAPFVNFAQARNAALQLARESELDWDYLLLCDADMELRVERPDWLNGHDGHAYNLKQVAGSLGYYNMRLVHRRAQGEYVGVTHEYLDVSGGRILDGAYFLDHADGANRPDKFRRDIKLLKTALKTETRPGLIQRYYFYLAQSYYDSCNWAKAAEYYKKRVEAGGWDEEVWNAQIHYAHCLANQGQKQNFIWEMLRAYQMRPTRAETLCDLAKYFRESGDNFISLLFSEPGLGMQKPNDFLFVAEGVYNHELKEEYAICAYYDPRRREQGAKINDMLVLAGSQQARGNSYWYLLPLKHSVPSFCPHRVDFTPPDGYVALNPSIACGSGGSPVVLVRTVNYTITAEGQYRIRASDGSIGADSPIHTRNFLGDLGGELTEISLPSTFPDPQFPLVLGFEDSRLFAWRGEFYTLSTVRSLTPEGWCEQVLAPLQRDGEGWRYGDNWRQIHPKDRRHEKNWMPWVSAEGGENLSFVYRLGTLISPDGEVFLEHKLPWNVDNISGGSQVVKIDSTYNVSYLAVVHEAGSIPGRSNRYYRHRFVIFGADRKPSYISAPFYFHDKEIEFAAGLIYLEDKRQIMVSYGVRDCEAWTATMDVDEVVRFAMGA